MAESYLARLAARLERERPVPTSRWDTDTLLLHIDALRILYRLVGRFNRHWGPEDRAYIEAALVSPEAFVNSGHYVQFVVAHELIELGKSAEGEIQLGVALAP